MLFNSYAFLFVFLPIVLVGYEVAGWFHRRVVVAWLGFMSLMFYAYWRPAFLIVLVASIAINYFAAGLISRHIPNRINSVIWLWTAIFLNLTALGYFKYLFPWLNFFSHVAGSSAHWTNVALPLGISFFTFTQIAFLVDLQQGVARQQDLSSYVLFVTFFPHLIAGPILHHKDMMPQFQQDRKYGLRLSDVSVGFSWFIMGLGKKVLLADVFAKSADAVFHATVPVPALAAWRGALCYALELYFDFSGYSDMALGLARMFSIDFPLNFNSPYKATSIIDFWQRWHMTLSHYITDYLYSPLQFWIRDRRRKSGKPVNRAAFATPGGFGSMIAFPMLFTMFIAGVWHGAGPQFILYGVLHGFFLTVNHGWNIFRQHRTTRTATQSIGRFMGMIYHVSSVLLTFLCVLVTLVFFRANSVRQALSLLAGMIGIHGAGPSAFALSHEENERNTFIRIVIGLFIVWVMPNTQQILSRFKPSLAAKMVSESTNPRGLLWVPRAVWAVPLGGILFFSLVHLQDPSTFLYFQF
jgi:alginate O-acetyltransferase complex protein AlgI